MSRKATRQQIRDKHEICERLRRIAVGRGLNPAEIAKAGGANPSTVYAVLYGHTLCPRFDTVQKIVIGLDAAWMSIVEQHEHSAEVLNLSVRRKKKA